MKQMTAEEMERHIPGQVTKEMCDYAMERFQHYAFLRREGKAQIAYCTACGCEWKTKRTVAHKEKTVCPHCLHNLQARCAGYSRKNLLEEFRILWYLPSLVSTDEITAVMLHVFRDYRHGYREIETQCIPCRMYVFRYGDGACMVKRSAGIDGWLGTPYGYGYVGKWETQKKINEAMPRYITFMTGYRCAWYENGDSLTEAVKGTPFQWMAGDGMTVCQSDGGSMLPFLALAAERPAVEYLMKLGLGECVQDRIDGNRTYGAIRWGGKSLTAVTGLTKRDIKDLKKSGARADCELLHYLRTGRRKYGRLTVEDAIFLAQCNRNDHCADGKTALKLLDYGTRETWQAYILEQTKKKAYEHTYGSRESVAIGDLMDYIRECEDLGLDLSDTMICRPKNLHEAHLRTSAEVRAIRAEREAAERAKAQQMKAEGYASAFRKRAKALGAFRFEHDGLILRPAETATELIEEGRILQHCVGGYCNSYATGRTVICFLRRAEEPDKPWHTVEFEEKTGRVIQCRGFKNKSTEAEHEQTSAFLVEFREQFKKQQRTAIKAERRTA